MIGCVVHKGGFEKGFGEKGYTSRYVGVHACMRNGTFPAPRLALLCISPPNADGFLTFGGLEMEIGRLDLLYDMAKRWFTAVSCSEARV